MRVMDGVMAIPGILLAIAMISLAGASLVTVVVAIAIPEIPRVARLVRGVVLSIREEPYVEAAVTVGTPLPKLLFRHVLPNTVAPLIVQGTYVCASAIIVEALLSFLGGGHPPRAPEQGEHHGRGARALPGGAVDRVLPRLSPRPRRARHQRPRRRLARHARPQARAPDGTVTPVLAIDGLTVRLPPGADRERAVDDIALTVGADETLCLVGESGSGKTVAAQAVMGLLPKGQLAIDAGRVELLGEDLTRAAPGRLAGAARLAHGDDLPGAHDGAQPGDAHRPPDRGSAVGPTPPCAPRAAPLRRA